MMWTLAWSKATGGSVTDQASALATDQTMPVDSGGNPLFPIPMYSVWWWAGATGFGRVRINAPKFRGIARPYIRPLEGALNPSSRPQLMESWQQSLLYNATEPIQPLQTDTVSETVVIVGTFGDLQRNVTPGDMYTMRATTSFTPTAGAWTISGALTFDDTLPTGQYEIQGYDTFNTGGVASRLVFLGPALPGVVPNVRPGIVNPTTVSSQSTRYFRYGYLGPFGRFINTALPQVEVLQTGATTNPDQYFDIVKVG